MVDVVTYGEHAVTPRGDYAQMATDWTSTQDWSTYTPEQHDRYRRLTAARSRSLHHEASSEFLHALARIGSSDGVPRFDRVSKRLKMMTGWELAPVPGLIPEAAFFALLASRRFPITTWLRDEAEFDYIVEPDVFHDFFGHVPLLFNPVFADYMQAFGAGGTKAKQLAIDDPAAYGRALEMMARLYWYTVEFGLISTPAGLRAYGAGILSSATEPAHALYSAKPTRLAFELERVMLTRYRIDDFQDTYFVIESFADLFDATEPDFSPIYSRLARMPSLPAAGRMPGDRTWPANVRPD
ncbi:phenylalanine 4-monooxygenase [soil metagenome]